MLASLDLDPSVTAAVVLPPLGRSDPPGEVVGEGLVVRGLGTGGLARSKQAVVVAAGGADGPTAVVVDTVDLAPRPVSGVDPAPRHGRGRGRRRARPARWPARRPSPAAWDEAVAAGRLALAHELVGASRAMLDLARDHALERIQFDRPIASFQAVRHRLAEALRGRRGGRRRRSAPAWLAGTPEAAAMAKALAGTQRPHGRPPLPAGPGRHRVHDRAPAAHLRPAHARARPPARRRPHAHPPAGRGRPPHPPPPPDAPPLTAGPGRLAVGGRLRPAVACIECDAEHGSRTDVGSGDARRAAWTRRLVERQVVPNGRAQVRRSLSPVFSAVGTVDLRAAGCRRAARPSSSRALVPSAVERQRLGGRRRRAALDPADQVVVGGRGDVVHRHPAERRPRRRRSRRRAQVALGSGRGTPARASPSARRRRPPTAEPVGVGGPVGRADVGLGQHLEHRLVAHPGRRAADDEGVAVEDRLDLGQHAS